MMERLEVDTMKIARKLNFLVHVQDIEILDETDGASTRDWMIKADGLAVGTYAGATEARPKEEEIGGRY